MFVRLHGKLVKRNYENDHFGLSLNLAGGRYALVKEKQTDAYRKTAKQRKITNFRDKSSCYLTSIEARGQDKDLYCFLSKMDASSVDPTHKTDPPDPVEDNACKEDLKPTNEIETISNTVSTSENIDNNEGNIVESVEHEGDADDTEHSSSSDSEHSERDFV